jgi:dTMP kinase
MSTNRGRFITLEGVEGAGKSSAMDVLRETIESAGHVVVTTREPGGTSLGEDLRALLLGHKHDGMCDDAELLLMFAARAEHLHRVIEPALAAGRWVLCDRFTDATYAYQGGGRGLSRARIAQLEQWVQGERRPDLTLLLDLPVQQGLARAGQRSAPDRFESEQAVFFDRVRAAYLAIAAAEPQRVRTVDASQDLPQVGAAIRAVMEDFLGRSE